MYCKNILQNFKYPDMGEGCKCKLLTTYKEINNIKDIYQINQQVQQSQPG